jgi:hypothetical protein
MKNFIPIIVLILSSQISAGEDAYGVTIYELLANQEEYAGKKVDVMGYYVSSFEHSVIYPSKEEASIGNYLSGIWLDGVTLENPSGKYIQVIGTFNPKVKGHMDMFRGTIKVDRSKEKKQN